MPGRFFPEIGSPAKASTAMCATVFDELDAPVIRVTGADVPMPYNKFLERAAKVDPGKIVAAVNRVLYREDEA